MPVTFDVRTLPQVTQVQSAIDAVLARVNVSVSGLQTQLVKKVAEFFATPQKIAQMRQRVAFVMDKARLRNLTDAQGKLTGITLSLADLEATYNKAKPKVQDALNRVNAAGLGASDTGLVGVVANAGILMASVFSSTKAQDAALTAIEKGVLTPDEAAQLYAQMQNPNAGRNLLIAAVAAFVLWRLVRR